MDAAAHGLFLLAIAVALVVLAMLLGDLLATGLPRLSWSFLTSYASRVAGRAGIVAPLVGSFYVMLLTAAIALPVGVGAAIFLEFYAEGDRPSPLRRGLTRLLQLNIDNLAGVPSIVYGLFGLAFFVRWLHLGRSVLAAALTLALMVLPVVIVSTREAVRAVPASLVHGAYALGASKTQVVFTVVLPAALGGILTGTILSVSAPWASRPPCWRWGPGSTSPACRGAPWTASPCCRCRSTTGPPCRNGASGRRPRPPSSCCWRSCSA